MNDISVVSEELFQGHCWRKPRSFSFAAQDHVKPLLGREMPKAIMGLPTGFVQHEGAYQLVAIQGFQNLENLLVGPNGNWLSNHIPEAYSGFPFQFVEAENEVFQLCICNQEEFVRPGEQVAALDEKERDNWHSFFADDSKPTAELDKVVSRLKSFATELAATTRNVSELAELGLISAWEIKLQDAGAEKQLQGLYRIDEQRLRALTGDELAQLRDSGGLTLAYCQLLSQRHLQGLALIAQRRASSERGGAELQFDLSDSGGSLNFDNL